MSDTSLEEKVDKLIEDVAEIRIALKGFGGNPGLTGRFEALAKDYFSFKRNCIGIFFFLVGSGVLGLGIAKLLEMVR